MKTTSHHTNAITREQATALAEADESIGPTQPEHHDADAPSREECLAEYKAVVARLEAGDTVDVPPWSTPEKTLFWAKEMVKLYS